MASLHADYEEGQEFTPDLYPSFPANAQPAVSLEVFSLAKLQAREPTEQGRLLEVCKTQGFFYLDFTGTSTESLPKVAEDLTHFSERLFKLPLEEKTRYKWQPGVSLRGYKPAGWGKADTKGTPESAEFMNIGKDDVLVVEGRRQVRYPALVYEDAPWIQLAAFQTSCHQTGLCILSNLATALDLPSNAFEDKHRITQPSDDHVRMTRGPPRKTEDKPEIQTPGHTDFGTITILFNWLGGLQVWSDSSQNGFKNVADPVPSCHEAGKWLWVVPKPGYAIVNLGDAAVKFTGGVLCSGRHRVVPAPGEQGLYSRFSLVYFVRPENHCVLKRIQGGHIPPLQEGEYEEVQTAIQWIKNQVSGLSKGKT